MTVTEDLFQIRDMLPTDENFIFATWLKGLYYGNEFIRWIPEPSFFFNYRRVIKAILGLPRVKVRVACLKEDPNEILGYAVIEENDEFSTLHWVFTKEVWRKMGVARKLAPDNVKEVTHLTKVGKSIKPDAWAYNPFLT